MRNFVNFGFVIEFPSRNVNFDLLRIESNGINPRDSNLNLLSQKLSPLIIKKSHRL